MDHLPIFLDATRQELLRADTGQVIDRPGRLQVTQPDAPVVWRNMIHHAILAPEEADAEIERVLAHYAALDVPFLWRVTPGCRPVDLGTRLEAHGFAHFETLACLVADPRDFAPLENPRVRIEDVTAANAETYIETMGDAWGMPEAGRARFRMLLQRELVSEARVQHAFLAYLDGEPRGVAQMSYFPQSVHFSGSAVQSSARGQGLYRAMVLHRMDVLRAQGRDLVTMHAVSNTSAPICKRMGFEDVLAMDSWCYPPTEATRG